MQIPLVISILLFIISFFCNKFSITLKLKGYWFAEILEFLVEYSMQIYLGLYYNILMILLFVIPVDYYRLYYFSI